MIALALTNLFGGLLIFFVSLPLIYRKIPMNRFYGVRIRASYASDQRWYEINAYGGRQLATWSWLMVAAGVAGLFIPSEHILAYAWGSVVIDLSAVFIPSIRILIWSRR